MKCTEHIHVPFLRMAMLVCLSTTLTKISWPSIQDISLWTRHWWFPEDESYSFIVRQNKYWLSHALLTHPIQFQGVKQLHTTFPWLLVRGNWNMLFIILGIWTKDWCCPFSWEGSLCFDRRFLWFLVHKLSEQYTWGIYFMILILLNYNKYIYSSIVLMCNFEVPVI